MMAVAFQKEVYTTGNVAKICKVAPRTVSKWFDSGRLQGYRIPGSQDRRIPRESLIRFLRQHGFPLGELEYMFNVLLVGGDDDLRGSLETYLAEANGKLFVAKSEFEAGIQIQGQVPTCVVIDFSIGINAAHMLAAHMKHHPEYAGIVLIGLIAEENQNNVNQELFADTFRKPFDPALLFHRIQTLIERHS